jgi:serum/glucocorticoid-regulated kinase 2
LKPENILITSSGHIKLADFGLSKENISFKDQTHSFCGSPAYVSPEVLLRKGHGISADIYGIGAILYELLTGMPCFYNDDMPVMYQSIKNSEIKFPEGISEEA